MAGTGSVRAGPSRPPRSTSGLLGRLRQAWAPLEKTPEGPPHLASLQHRLAPAQPSTQPGPCPAQPSSLLSTAHTPLHPQGLVFPPRRFYLLSPM